MEIKRDWLYGLGVFVLLGWLFGASVLGRATAGEAATFTAELGLADLDVGREEARGELLKQLEELAVWCTKKKIYAKRVLVYESMLHFDPENSIALRGMGFIKNSDGEWIEKKRRVAPKDFDKRSAGMFDEKRSEVVMSYRDSMFTLLDEYKGKISPKQVDSVLDDILFADPDDLRVHELRGEAKQDDAWVLVETVKAKKQRAVLRDMVRAAFRGVPESVEGTPNAREDAFNIGWKAVYVSPIVRSIGTGTTKEIKRMTEAMAATQSYFNAALKVEANYPDKFTVYTLVRKSDKMAFIIHHPSVDQTYRDFLSQLDGSGIQGSGDLAHWSEEPTRRLDGMVRQAIGWLFAESYGILPKHGWLFEGFGIYMTRELVGTRLTWYVRPSNYLIEEEDLALKQRLLDTRTNWMNEAKKVLDAEKRPNLALMLGRDVNKLTTEDLLYSYALAAYLLEAENEKIPTIFKRIGKGELSLAVLTSELELDLPEIEERVQRWLNERR
ncbi:MAG: hypothetical protein ACI8X5_003914 [Planctomycetota bacterium]|jgi:hypothetical protein